MAIAPVDGSSAFKTAISLPWNQTGGAAALELRSDGTAICRGTPPPVRSSSWLNLVERWFNELTARRLRRGVFTSVPSLIEAIEVWAEHWNDDPKPFVWHKPAEEIIEKVRRGRTTLAQVKTATRH